MNKKVTNTGENTNGGETTIMDGMPYTVTATIQGTADILFHRWNCESIEEKAKAAKGSKAKKSDDIEAYLYRNDDGFICLPGEYVRQAVIHAAKFRQDPRSPRKSAMDLTKAGVVSLTPLASFGSKDYDFEDKRRVTVQRAGITRTRPAMKAGWTAEITFMVNLPEYITPDFLYGLLSDAGRLIGVGDFRPSYGRFIVTSYEVHTEIQDKAA